MLSQTSSMITIRLKGQSEVVGESGASNDSDNVVRKLEEVAINLEKEDPVVEVREPP